MELSGTKVSCRQCGTTLINEIDIPPSPTPYLHGTLYLPNESETVDIKNYIANVEGLLETLDADLALLHTITSRIERTRKEMLRALGTNENLITPIRRIPFEIMTEIFGLCCPARDSKHRPQESLIPFRLAQVCVRWRNISLRVPKLWSKIELQNDGPWNQCLLNEWLLRSGNRPLELHISHFGDKHLGLVKSSLQLLVRDSSRWKNASFTLPYDMALSYLQSAKGQLPMLESLSIFPHTHSDLDEPELIDFFEDAPNLHQLTLNSLPRIENLRNTFHRLTHLDIIGFSNITVCLDTLQSCSKLVELKISFDQWYDDDTIPKHTIPMICLNQMQRLSIISSDDDDEEDPGFNAVFDYLETPDLRHLSLAYYLNHEWITSSSCLSFMRRSSHSLTSLHIASPDEVVEDDRGPNVAQCLQVLPGLTTLKIEDQWGDIFTRRVVQALIVDSNQPLASPMLEKLELIAYTFSEPHVFADMVESRHNPLDADNSRRLKTVKARLITIQGPCQKWLTRLKNCRQQGLQILITVTGDGEEEKSIL